MIRNWGALISVGIDLITAVGFSVELAAAYDSRNKLYWEFCSLPSRYLAPEMSFVINCCWISSRTFIVLGWWRKERADRTADVDAADLFIVLFSTKFMKEN